MDLLRNYHGFGDDILSSFKNLIDEFDLKLSEPYDGTYLLTGKNCILRFTYDRGQIGCAFKQITDDQINPGYEVWSVQRQISPIIHTNVQNSNGEWGTAKQQLQGYSNKIETKLKNILDGDFSWLPDYLEHQKKEGNLSLLVLGLDRNHPIYKKFWAGDLTWQADAEKLISEGAIKQPPPGWSNSIFRNILDKLNALFQ